MDTADLVVLLVALYLLVLLLRRCLRRLFEVSRDAGGSPRPSAPSRSPDPSSDGVDAYLVTERTSSPKVVCAECGTRNEREYQFCRTCVTELPSARADKPGVF